MRSVVLYSYCRLNVIDRVMVIDDVFIHLYRSHVMTDSLLCVSLLRKLIVVSL